MRPTYVVHSASGGARAAFPAVLAGVLVVVVAGVLQGHRVFAGIGVVLMLVLGAGAARRGWTRLRVDESGIALSFAVTSSRGSYGGAVWRTADWRSVHRVVVRGGEEVQVVLRNDAPMPPWLTSRIIDPSDPEGGVRYAREVPGLDATALDLAVRSLAPHVEVRTVSA